MDCGHTDDTSIKSEFWSKNPDMLWEDFREIFNIVSDNHAPIRSRKLRSFDGLFPAYYAGNKPVNFTITVFRRTPSNSTCTCLVV